MNMRSMTIRHTAEPDGVGQCVEALERFVWQTVHQRFYRRRDEWFARRDHAG